MTLAAKKKVILIDHRDSFTFNIKSWLSQRFNVEIVDSSHLDLDLILTADLLVLSPGPNSPSDYPMTLQLIKSLPKNFPVLGICLGMQLMTLANDGQVYAYTPPVHGKTTPLRSSNLLINNQVVARYHSLACRPSIDCEVLAETHDQIPMIVLTKNKKWLGYQFHPESFMTENSNLYLDFIKTYLL